MEEVKAFFEEEGYEVLTADTGKEGLDALTVRMLKSGGRDNATAVMLRVGG